MASEEPTDWIKDGGWLSGLYEAARRGNRSEFDVMLRRLLYEHGRALTTPPPAVVTVDSEALAEGQS